MFTDEILDDVGFSSTWKKERSVKESGAQTSEMKTRDAGAQAVKTTSHEAQTDEEIPEDIRLYEDDSPELLSFLKKMEPLVAKELEKNRRSRAFDGYSVNWEEDTGAVACVHTLSHADIVEQLQVTGVSWNSTGSVIAVAYGRYDHEDWCTHRSLLCTWNISRRKIEETKADVSIELSSCLMCIAYHPQQPSWIAGGTFGGEVMVWDTSRDDDMLVASSRQGEDSHCEPVNKLVWVTDSETKGNKYRLVSVASDGTILVWSLSHHQQSLRLVEGFVLLTESLPRRTRAKIGRTQGMGVTCISFSREDETDFLIGSDSGGIYRCSTKSRGTAANKEMRYSVQLHSPVTFTFEPHRGPVYGVEHSPYHRNLFISCSTDGSLRIYSILQTQPVMTIEPNTGYLYAIRWSPSRPLVFSTVSGNGQLLIYDLLQSRSMPALSLEASKAKSSAYAVLANDKQSKLLATGDGVGNVMIWRLTEELTSGSGRDQDILNEIANLFLD